MSMPDPFRLMKRDIDLIQYQRELMRQASWTSPAVSLSGKDWSLVRQFAYDSYMQVKPLYPEAFRGKGIDDWEKAVRTYVTTRRPEFRELLLKQLRGHYAGGYMDPDLLLYKSVEEIQKKGSAMDFTTSFIKGFAEGLDKVAKEGGGKHQPFLKKTIHDPSKKPAKVKEIFRALKRDHPGMSAEKKARIALRRGSKSKEERRPGPPYEAPLSSR